MRLNLPLQQVEPPVEQPLVEARIVGGMNSRIDPADIENPVASLSKNSRVSSDYTMRAPGVELISASPPDAKPVLLYTQYQRFDGTNVLLRFSEDRVDKFSGGAYTNLTGTLNGTNKDRFRYVITADASDDFFIFTNNGVDPLKVLNTGATSFSDLGLTDTYKYVTAFFNRIVVANKTGLSPNPVLLRWSGDYNYDEWNPLTDISAGFAPIVEAQSDFADEITGLFAFASVMLILRERSLWIATKRPVASNPFQFQAAFPSVGCDTPNSAVQIPNGLIWYDFRTNQVYVYEVGGQPTPVGEAIKDTIADAISDRELVYGSYDRRSNTYFLTVPSTTTTNSRIFVFHLTSQSWSYDDREGVYGVYPVDSGIGRLTYGQLTGTYAQLTAANATYGAIGLTPENPPTNNYGYADGEIGKEIDSDTNAEEFCWESKVYRIPAGDLMVSRLMLLHQPLRDGTLTLEYKRNGGNWIAYKTQNFHVTEGRKRTYCTKLIRANEFQWRVRCSSGNTKLLEYKLTISGSPEDK